MSNIIITKLDADQVIRKVYDEDAQALRTTGGGSGGDTTVVQPDGSQLHVTVDSSALPTGAATEVTLASVLSELLAFAQKSKSADVTEAHDYKSFTYVAAGFGVGQVETITYRLGGAGGTIVATQTLTYDSQDRVASVAKT